MKKRDVSHWIKNEHFEGLLLFAQALEEGAFYYSYESYKLPALNSHYLCYDITHTARDIDRKVLMDGNFIPLAEEFEQMLKEDIFIKNNVDDKGTILYAKDKNGDFYDLSIGDLKSKINSYPEIAEYLIDICETNNNYLSELLGLLIDNIFCDNFDQDNRAAIYTITRMLITDLVNAGYSKEYLYSTIEDFFFTASKPIECNTDTVVSFFNCFTFDDVEYEAVFGINIKAARFFERLDNIEVRDATPEEKRQLNLQKSTDKVVVIPRKEVDVYSAFESAVRRINTFLSFHRINQHDSKLFITPKAVVYVKDDEGNLKDGTPIRTSINPLKKKGNSSDLHALFDDITLSEKIDIPKAFYRAMALHSGAIESKDISNQLLNLWTVVEVLIDTKRDNEDKINTICTILGAVLNRCYMYSNIEQLYHDIKICSSSNVDEILEKIEPSCDDLDKVERLALLLSLDTYSAELTELIDSLTDSPLLIYRIKQFAEHILSDSQSIYKYLKRHEKRIKWHIMRIYRNRNMIVHNGSSMPYRDIIIENLHYYVDVLIDTLIEYYNIGITTHTSIYKNILNEQANYYVALGTPLSKKAKATVIQLTADNALEMIFNEYSGNPIKKAIDHALEKNRSEQHNSDEQLTEVEAEYEHKELLPVGN